jgi:hypothetical protein
VRQLREELYAGSPHLRRRLEAAGYRPWRFRGVEDLAGLPTSDLAELTTLPTRDLLLRPAPRAMKELWPFGRKLALVLAGGRAARLLGQAYDPVLATQEQGLAVTWTQTDLELAGEFGARVLDLCGLTDGAQLDLRLGEEPSFAGLMLARGAQRSGLALEENARSLAVPSAHALEQLGRLPNPAALELVLLVGLPPDQDLRRELEQLAPKAKLATCWCCGPARVALVAGPTERGTPPSDLLLFPDLVAAERVDPATGEPCADGAPGELVLTGLGNHGTALLRFRTGVQAGDIDWNPCPRSGRRLPRVKSLEPLS